MMNFSAFHHKYSGRYHKKLIELCNPLFRSYNLTTFVYQFSIENRFATICTNEELQYYYFDQRQKRYKSNPFIMNPHTVQPGLYFREHIRNQQFQNTNLDLQDKFKIDFTFRIIQKKGNITEQFCFGRLPDTKNYDHLVVNKLFGIYDFTHDFQKVMADVLKKMAHDALDISCDMQAADATTIGIPNFDLQKSSLKKENYTFLASLEFTLREIDYLKFYFKGYSAKSIGEKLFVSPRTVEGHVMRLKDKLGCHNKAELLDTLQVMKDAHIHPEIFSGG